MWPHYIRCHMARVSSAVRQFARGPGVAIGAATALVALVGIIRESAAASTLGIGRALDSYVSAVAVMLLVASALISTASSAALPELARRAVAFDMDDLRALAIAVATAATVVGSAAGVLVRLCAPEIARIVGGDELDVVSEIEGLIAYGAVVIIGASALRGALMATLQSVSWFVLPAGAPAISSSCVAVVALVTEATPTDLVRALMVGLLAEAFVLAGAVGVAIRPRLRLLRRGLGLLAPICGRAGFGFMAALVFGVNATVDYSVANRLEDGAAAQLALASRIPLAVAGLLVAVFVTPFYTRLARAMGDGGRQGVAQLYRGRVWRVTVVSSCVAVATSIVGFAAARILFSHGELTDADALDVAMTQVVYALSLVPFVLGGLAGRALLAADRQGTQFLVALAGALLNLVLSVALGSVVGRNGVALATGVVYFTTFGAMGILVVRSAPRRSTVV